MLSHNKPQEVSFFPEKAEFVGVIVMDNSNALAKSKFKAMLKMVELPPATATDLLALIDFWVFCQEWMPCCKV